MIFIIIVKIKNQSFDNLKGGHRVPALLHWPSKIPPRRESSLVSMLVRINNDKWKIVNLRSGVHAGEILFTRPVQFFFGADPVHRIRAWFSWWSWNLLMKTICQDIPATLAALGGGSYNSFSDGFDLLPSLLNGEPWPRFLNSKNKGWSKRRRKHILQISACAQKWPLAF